MKLEVIVNHKLIRLEATILNTQGSLIAFEIKTFNPVVVNWLYDRFNDEKDISMKIIGKDKVFKGTIVRYAPSISSEIIDVKALFEGKISGREVFIFR